MPPAHLRVTDAGGSRLIVLDKPLFLIGRRVAADLQLPGTDVSRDHAEIARDGDRFLLRDRGSRAGTFVNGEPVAERALEHGDRIRIGHADPVDLTFLRESHESLLGDLPPEDADLGQMAAVLNGLRALGSGQVLDDVLTLVLDSALEVTKAERGFVMLAADQGELQFTIARGTGRVTLPGTSFTTSAKIPRQVFLTGRSLLVGDLLDGDLAGTHHGTIAVGIRHVLAVPLVVNPPASPRETRGQRVIGVLYLDGRERSRMHAHSTLASLEAFATQAALAIESARLYAESEEKARIDRELRVAADIQRALLPQMTSSRRTCDLAATFVPCRTVGGDFFDYLDIGDDVLGIALGDVAGKGPPAAILATAVQSNFVALAPVSRNPADTMARINAALLRRAIDARFATMFYGAVASDGTLRYCNAGQEPPLVLRRNGREWLGTGGPVLGLLPSAAYDWDTVQLEPGDLVVICSDGITEARNAAGDEYGRERIADALEGCHHGRPDEVLERLLASVHEFSGDTPQGDDMTALVLRYIGQLPD